MRCFYCGDYLRRSATLVAMTVFAASFWVSGGLFAQEGGEPPLATPQLFQILPEICPTPDGLAMDANGNVFLSCPNYFDKTHPAVLMKIDPKNRLRLFCVVPIHPKTGVACPMGIDFAPNGDLYIADNQDWGKSESKEQGRILRLIIKDGQPVAAKVVAYGMNHPNGVRVHDGHVYVTQSLMPKAGEKPIISGLYRFELDAAPVRVINNPKEDSNLLTTFKTLNLDVQYGVDGLVFDSKGNLYLGNFGDATIHKITFDSEGNVATNTRWAKDEAVMKSIDGLGIGKDDTIYVADFSNNAICVVSPEGKVSLLAKSPDCDGSKGGLDQPGEPLVRGNELIIVNFDMVTGGGKVNTKHDLPQTLSVIKLDKP